MASIKKKIVTGTIAATLVLGGGIAGLLHNQAQAFAASSGSTAITADNQNENDQETADDAGQQTQSETNDLSQADLQKQAAITKEQSVTIATAQVQGTVKDVQLEDENGAAVYNVQIQDSNAQITEVKVDAKTGKITKTEQADNSQEAQDQETNDDQQ
jgi:uncharacterized membrane protein YkoI